MEDGAVKVPTYAYRLIWTIKTGVMHDAGEAMRYLLIRGSFQIKLGH